MRYPLLNPLTIRPSSLAGIYQLAQMSQVNLGEALGEADFERLEQVWGDTAAIKNNPTVASNFGLVGDIPSKKVLDLLVSTGMLMRQRWRTVRGRSLPNEPVTGLLFGGRVPQVIRQIKEFGHYAQHCLTQVVLCSDEPRHFLGDVGSLVMSLHRVPATDSEVLAVLLKHRYDVAEWVIANDLEQQVRQFAQAAPRSVYVPALANRLPEVLAVRRILREEWGKGFDATGSAHKFYFSQDSLHLARQQRQLFSPTHQAPLEVFPSLVRLLGELVQL